MKVLLANPRGFCAGVDRAIEIVERAIILHGAPIYVRHEVVHNRFVVDDLRQRGAVFIDDLAEVPEGATVVFSAHGVSQAVRREDDARGLLGEIEGSDGVLAHGLLILLVQFGIFVFDDFSEAKLGQLFGNHLLVEKAALD